MGYPAGVAASARRLPKGFVGAADLVAPWVPGILNAFTVAASLVLPRDWPTGWSVVIGFAVSFLVALALLAALSRDAVAPEHANEAVFAEVSERIKQIRLRLEESRKVLTGPTPEEAEALAEVVEDLRAIDDSIHWRAPGETYSGARWVLATGYIDLWRRIHRAEEALVMVEARSFVLAGASQAELRLTGSAMGNKDGLLKKVTAAAEQLRNTPQNDRGLGPRAEISGVWHAINDYRDDIWHGIVRMRNRLSQTMIFTGFMTYGVLLLALVSDVDRKLVVGASAFYLVGAVVGLFARLRIQAEADSAIEDYGLSHTRLVLTPLLSGIAAVGGVVATPFIASSVVQVYLQSTGASAAGPPPLETIFDLGKSPGGLVWAAVFGLSPDLIVDQLTSVAKGYKQKLGASAAADSNPAP